jgi:orotate phosphoribosyltransferase-like protein
MTNTEQMARNAYAMRKSGMTYEDIARELDVSIAFARNFAGAGYRLSKQPKSRIMSTVHTLLRAAL